MKAINHLTLSLIIIFIAGATIFYIFDSIDKISTKCQSGELTDVCQDLSGLTLPMLFILLILGGLVMIILSVVYIMLSL